MNAKTLTWVVLGSVIGLVTLVLVVVVPASEDECDTTTVPSSAAPPLGGYPPGDPRAAGASGSGAPSSSAVSGTAAFGSVTASSSADRGTANEPAAATHSAVTGTASLAAGNAPIRRTWPLPGGAFQISDTFGARGGAHLGVDLAAAENTPIFSVADGVVVAAGPASGFGNWIVVDSIDVNGRPFSAVYGHEWESGVKVRVGQTVRAGQEIGAVGSAGESSGPHLHFEIVPGGRFTGGRQIDPLPWLDGAPTPSGGGAWPYSADPRCLRGFGTAGGALADGKVPPELEIWYRRAGSLCPEITPSILAAQGRQESGFRRGLTSPAGAQGLAQFLPSTARATNPDDGQPYLLDADSSGAASLWDDGDSIMAQGRYMCSIAHQVERWIGEGKVNGDVIQLTLAAYNAGEGAVLASGGMPNQVPGHFSETRPYVANILAMEAQFRSPGSMGRFQPDGRSGSGVVQAAEQWLGTPYVWGGGGPSGPTGGGLDGPGLTSAAVFAASSGQVTLPQTAEQQWEMGAEVSMNKAQPGDLVFSDFGPRGPADVGIYAGNGTMIRSTNPSGVREVPIPGDGRLRRVL
ncbi:peptidoglycan DD-metalloendopeptidase family protein [Nocardia sp. BMG51109]|uniref:peptidoglycan DD-metalloendopeptidase family protein n=1 Tax=Nocardia sp. BMG51109 TaxID=1056816 RepID=UPI000463AB03|nr:peptidoglycan DD-metalloendopeptidase family protein [Nocardia sp. BMG51109]